MAFVLFSPSYLLVRQPVFPKMTIYLSIHSKSCFLSLPELCMSLLSRQKQEKKKKTQIHRHTHILEKVRPSGPQPLDLMPDTTSFLLKSLAIHKMHNTQESEACTHVEKLNECFIRYTVLRKRKNTIMGEKSLGEKWKLQKRIKRKFQK